MAHIALKKLMSDIKDFNSGDYTSYFHIAPKVVKNLNEDGSISDEENLFHWAGTIYGPKESPYENGKYRIDISIPEAYPNRPPIIKFLTKVFHPNISLAGVVCLNILKSPPNGDWKPSINLPKTILCIHNLLFDPNPADPLNYDAGALYSENKLKFNETAKEWNAKYAI
jgi:ubiquitin-conjugating enzyme E2 T